MRSPQKMSNQKYFFTLNFVYKLLTFQFLDLDLILKKLDLDFEKL
jgi:hypothetical protein